MSHHQCTAVQVWAKCTPHCSVLLCRTGSQQACVTAITPREICSSYKCAVIQQKCTAALVCAKCNSHCSVLLCKTGSQLACVTAVTPMEACSSYRCAVSHHQCTAAQVLAKCNSHCSVLLCKTGSQLACVTAITPMKLCCFIQVCSDPPPMNCSTGLGKTVQCCSATSQQAVPLQSHLCIALQVGGDPTMEQHWFSCILQQCCFVHSWHCNYTYAELFIQVAVIQQKCTHKGQCCSAVMLVSLQSMRLQ